MRVLIVDNFDSFTHNLAQALGGLGAEVAVLRNVVPLSAVAGAGADAIVISPGPGRPEQAGVSAAVVGAFSGRLPVLGVCLGMQVIAACHGARVHPAPRPVHGWSTDLSHDGRGVFAGLPGRPKVGRYHSLCVDAPTLPADLVPTAWSDGVLMGLRHRALPVEGVQFHPESILTPEGPRMLLNFLGFR
jgi:anthranilate synthase/aminodeoxychorismate synthase-like glutamine amidotransferase